MTDITDCTKYHGFTRFVVYCSAFVLFWLMLPVFVYLLDPEEGWTGVRQRFWDEWSLLVKESRGDDRQ